MSLLPLILHFAWLISQNRRLGWLGLSLTTFALIASHNLTALIALPILGLLGVIWLFWHATNWKKDLTVLVSGFIAGGVLSASYAIPAFLEKDTTIISEITSGYFDYRLHFLYIRQFFQVDWGFGGSAYGPDDDISFHFGYLTMLLAGLAGLGGIVDILQDFRSRRKFLNIWHFRPTQILILITSLILGATLLLTTFKSQWFWDQISLLAFIQFPWRVTC